MAELATLAEVESLFLATAHRSVSVLDPDSCAEAAAWWEEMTARGGEGMVVKPLDFVVRGSRGIVQPAIKCRGREYLRIIYGPDYPEPQHLDRFRTRALAPIRHLPLRAFALGSHPLDRSPRPHPLRP